MLCSTHSSPLSDSRAEISVAAPAKLNLYLRVLRRRDDGYHELQTLMVTVGWYDTLRFSPAVDGGLSLTCYDARNAAAGSGTEPNDLPVGPSNLVFRAAELLRGTTGRRLGAQIRLWKRIPLAAGLAGGSSDAAAALWGLDRLWKLQTPPEVLNDLAAQLGSDVPFFLARANAAVCRGRGELVTPLQLPAGLHFVVARPATGLSTAEVYRRCRPEAADGGLEALVGALQRGRLAAAGAALHNSLLPAARELNPDVERLQTLFSRLPFAGHLMSGSGASYFGLCRHRREALHLAGRIRAAGAGTVFVVSNRT